MKELWKRVLIYGSFTSMYVVAISKIQDESNLVGVSLFSLIFFIILSLVYELGCQDQQ